MSVEYTYLTNWCQDKMAARNSAHILSSLTMYMYMKLPEFHEEQENDHRIGVVGAITVSIDIHDDAIVWVKTIPH